MPEGILQRILKLFQEESPSRGTLLLEIAQWIPASLLLRAVYLARQIADPYLRGLVLPILLRRLPESEQRTLRRQFSIPTPGVEEFYASPLRDEIRDAMATLSEGERHELLEGMFRSVEDEHGGGSSAKSMGPEPDAAKSGGLLANIGGRQPAESSDLSAEKVKGEPPARSADKSPASPSYYYGDSSEDSRSEPPTPTPTPTPTENLPRMREERSGFNDELGPKDAWAKHIDDRDGGGDEFAARREDAPPASKMGWRGDERDWPKDSSAKSSAPPLRRGGGWSRAKPPGYAAPPESSFTVEESQASKEAISATISVSAAPPPPSDVVNLGFAPRSQADNRLFPNQSLACSTPYYLWVNVGYPLKESAGEGKSLGIDKLPKESRLKVALFSFEDEIEITPGEDVGELQIQPNGTVKVTRQPTQSQFISFSANADSDILENFLFFPVQTPKEAGHHRLRCNFYCEQMLVQSHLITAHVRDRPTLLDRMGVPEPLWQKAVSAKVDYALSQTLSPEHLASLAENPHLLSIMLNSSDDGSYNIRFFGGDDAAGVGLLKDDAPIDADEIKGFLEWARGAMHKVAWDREEEWDAKNKWPYRYQKENFDAAKLAKDLAYLARAGGRIYWGILDNLKLDNEKLEELMSRSGLVQIALKLSPPAVLPAAIIYDYAWDSDAFEDFDNTPFTLCETFQAGIEAANKGLAQLEDCLCFKGQCSLKAQIKAIQEDPDKNLRDLPPIICPSGFWGYRHALGFPLTLDKTFDADPVITYGDQLRVVAGVSTDPELVERDDHIARLKVLTKSVGLDRDESYDEILKRLKATKPHLIYFYCHGGVRLNKLPYLEIGKNDRFSPENFPKEGIRWPSNPRPLVFINGCHTTSLNPEIALNFVTPLVQLGGASGVIGTEITIFEPLAVKFAEECLQRFLGAPPYTAGMPIGQAVRGARLELLRRGNPLGLVYIPFVIASLRMLGEQPN